MSDISSDYSNVLRGKLYEIHISKNDDTDSYQYTIYKQKTGESICFGDDFESYEHVIQELSDQHEMLTDIFG